MEEVLISIPFLDRLTDDELYRLCATSRVHKQICKTYIPGRVKDRYGINVDSLDDFEILALYSEDRITLMDALLRSILRGNKDMEAYFRALNEKKYGSGCNDSPVSVSAIGYIMSGNLESLINKCPPSKDTLSFLQSIAQLEDQEEVAAFLKGKFGSMSEEFDVEAYPSADIIEYIIKNKNRTPLYDFDAGELLNVAMFSAIDLDDIQALKPLLKLSSRYCIQPYTELIALIVIRKLVEQGILDQLITPYNFDSILRNIIQEVTFTSEVPPHEPTGGLPEISPLSYIRDLLRRYSRHLGFESRGKGGILSVLNSLFNPSGEAIQITRVDTLEDIRELVEAMLESNDKSASKLGRYIVGLDVPSDQYVKELAAKIRIKDSLVLLAAFDNLPLMRAILDKLSMHFLRVEEIREALNIADQAGYEDLVRYLSDVMESRVTRREGISSHHPDLRARYSRRIKRREPISS